MLKTTRFTLWSYRWALPGMVGVMLFVTFCNILSNPARDIHGYASGMISSYLLFIPFMITMLSVSSTLQFSISMGQPRRKLMLELPVLNLVFTALLDVLCLGGGLVVLRLASGTWQLGLQGLAAVMLSAGWALGAAGQLIGLLGVRFGWKGWLGGFGGLLALGGAGAALVFLAPWGLGEKLLNLLQFSTDSVSLQGLLCLLAMAAVVCAACHAGCWLLVRRYTVK